MAENTPIFTNSEADQRFQRDFAIDIAIEAILTTAFGPRLGRSDEYSFFENYTASATRSIGFDVLGELARPMLGNAGRDVSAVANQGAELRAIVNGQPFFGWGTPLRMVWRGEDLVRDAARIPNSIRIERNVDHILEQVQTSVQSMRAEGDIPEAAALETSINNFRQGARTPDLTRVMDNVFIQGPLTLGSFAVHLMSGGEMMRQPLSLRSVLSL